MRTTKFSFMLAVWMLMGFQQNLPAQLPNLTLDTISKYRNAIEPTAEESAFLNINWFSALGDAVRTSNDTKKPLLIYVMNGHPLGCT